MTAFLDDNELVLVRDAEGSRIPIVRRWRE
jgi:hypothetical protein